MQYNQVHGFLMNKLENDLSPDYSYHNAKHTTSVIQVTQQLANAENVNGSELELLNTAALFHDAGFLKDHDEHEMKSCLIAHEFLPGFDYSQEQIDTICNLIMATKLPQAPSNLLEEIICDADLHYIGTDHYFAISENLFKEYLKIGVVKNRGEWRKKQIQFFNSHRFFTDTAIKEYAAKKEENLRLLKREDIAIKKEHNMAATIKDILLMVVGVLIAGFGLQSFLVPNKLLDGGVTGISLLLHELYHFNLGYVILICNMAFIIASYFSVSKRFAWKTFFCVLTLAACLMWLPYPEITKETMQNSKVPFDLLLVSIFGGVFLGLGMGMTMRAGCALDGIEVLAVYTWKRTSFTITEIIMAINIIIFGIATFKLGPLTALYSVLTYLAATKTIDYVVEGLEAYTGVTIISGNSELIKERLVNEMGKSITIYKGQRGFLPGKYEISADCDIIFTVITRLELRRLKNLVYESDPKAFVFANTIKEASGGILKRRHVH